MQIAKITMLSLKKCKVQNLLMSLWRLRPSIIQSVTDSKTQRIFYYLFQPSYFLVYT